MVEGSDEANVFAEQHAVAEHISAHIADAHDREILILGVEVELTEVTLDRFPGTARGDAHRLVVVAD